MGQVLTALRTRTLTPCPCKLTRTHTLPRPLTQIDVIFALAKCNWHCGVPRCRRRLNPWAAENGWDEIIATDDPERRGRRDELAVDACTASASTM